MNLTNLLLNLPQDLSEERIETLAEGLGTLRLERIISRGQSSPPDFWYDQETREWVLLLQGSATLRLKQEDSSDRILSLQPGDFLEIPAHCLHRVEATSQEEETIWFAIHLQESAAP